MYIKFYGWARGEKKNLWVKTIKKVFVGFFNDFGELIKSKGRQNFRIILLKLDHPPPPPSENPRSTPALFLPTLKLSCRLVFQKNEKSSQSGFMRIAEKLSIAFSVVSMVNLFEHCFKDKLFLPLKAIFHVCNFDVLILLWPKLLRLSWTLFLLFCTFLW